MSAEVWYHGTRAGFLAGGLVLPRNETGAQPTRAPLNPGRRLPADQGSFVYMTRDLDVAWSYARAASGRGKPKVLVVRPLSQPQRDREHGPGTDTWRCTAATVSKVLRDAPPLKDRLTMI